MTREERGRGEAMQIYEKTRAPRRVSSSPRSLSRRSGHHLVARDPARCVSSSLACLAFGVSSPRPVARSRLPRRTSSSRGRATFGSRWRSPRTRSRSTRTARARIRALSSRRAAVDLAAGRPSAKRRGVPSIATREVPAGGRHVRAPRLRGRQGAGVRRHTELRVRGRDGDDAPEREVGARAGLRLRRRRPPGRSSPGGVQKHAPRALHLARLGPGRARGVPRPVPPRHPIRRNQRSDHGVRPRPAQPRPRGRRDLAIANVPSAPPPGARAVPSPGPLPARSRRRRRGGPSLDLPARAFPPPSSARRENPETLASSSPRFPPPALNAPLFLLFPALPLSHRVASGWR